jgi:hypothetical protein
MPTTNVTAYRTSDREGREVLHIFASEDGPTLASLPPHLTDAQVVAICRTCGWNCTEVLR